MEYFSLTDLQLETDFVDVMKKTSIASGLADHPLMDTELIHAALGKEFRREVEKLKEHLYSCGFTQLDVDDMKFWIDGDALDDEDDLVAAPILPKGAVRIDWTYDPDYTIYSFGGDDTFRGMLAVLCETINESSNGSKTSVLACATLEMIRKQNPKSILAYNTETRAWVKNITAECTPMFFALALTRGLQKLSLIARPELKPNPCRHCKIQLGDDELGTNPFHKKDGNAYCKGCFNTGKYRHYQKPESDSDSDSEEE